MSLRLDDDFDDRLRIEAPGTGVLVSLTRLSNLTRSTVLAGSDSRNSSDRMPLLRTESKLLFSETGVRRLRLRLVEQLSALAGGGDRQTAELTDPRLPTRMSRSAWVISSTRPW